MMLAMEIPVLDHFRCHEKIKVIIMRYLSLFIILILFQLTEFFIVGRLKVSSSIYINGIFFSCISGIMIFLLNYLLLNIKFFIIFIFEVIVNTIFVITLIFAVKGSTYGIINDVFQCFWLYIFGILYDPIAIVVCASINLLVYFIVTIITGIILCCIFRVLEAWKFQFKC